MISPQTRQKGSHRWRGIGSSQLRKWWSRSHTHEKHGRYPPRKARRMTQNLSWVKDYVDRKCNYRTSFFICRIATTTPIHVQLYTHKKMIEYAYINIGDRKKTRFNSPSGQIPNILFWKEVSWDSYGQPDPPRSSNVSSGGFFGTYRGHAHCGYSTSPSILIRPCWSLE